jgi:hypothetical protein
MTITDTVCEAFRRGEFVRWDGVINDEVEISRHGPCPARGGSA